MTADKDELAAYHAAIRLLSRREYCAAELQAKLIGKGFEPDRVRAVLERLQREHYLSEERFAESFLRSRIERGEAPWLAAEKARRKGASSAAVAAALEQIQAHYDARRACRKLLQRRDPAGRYRSDQEQWRRQARFLRSKGYDHATILSVLNEEQPEEEQ